jgi:hypothetical protein
MRQHSVNPGPANPERALAAKGRTYDAEPPSQLRRYAAGAGGGEPLDLAGKNVFAGLDLSVSTT